MGGRQIARVRRKLGLSPVIGKPIALLTTQLRGGKAKFMEFARLAAQIEPGLAHVMESYDSLNPVLRRAVSIDELCAKHGVDPTHYIAVVGEAALKFRNNSAILMISLSMPEIVSRSIKEAMKPDGWRDRKFLFEHAGIIPVPAGQTINVGVTASAAAKAETVKDNERGGLPSFERTIMDTDDIIRGRKN